MIHTDSPSHPLGILLYAVLLHAVLLHAAQPWIGNRNPRLRTPNGCVALLEFEVSRHSESPFCTLAEWGPVAHGDEYGSPLFR